MIRNFSNVTEPTSLTAPASNSAATITVATTAGFPAVPFIIAIDRGTADEEVCLVSNVTSTTMTVQRGFDGTSAMAHSSGASVEHCATALDYYESNRHIEDTARDDHTQYLNLTRAKVYHPKAVTGGSPTEVGTITTTYQGVNSLTIASATFPRLAIVFATVPVTFAMKGVTYVARIVYGGTARGYGRHFESGDGGLPVINVMSEPLTLAAGVSHTINIQVRRDSGAGGIAPNDPVYNRVHALLFANV